MYFKTSYKVIDFQKNNARYVKYLTLLKIYICLFFYLNYSQKYFFKQLEAHKKFNSVKEKDYEKEIIDETCYG